MQKKIFLDMTALKEWQAEIISWEEQQEGFLLHTSCGSRFLHIAESEAAVKAELKTEDHLLEQGFFAFPRIIRNRFGEFFAHGYNGFYYMTDAIMGKAPDWQNSSEVQEAAGCLGAFHAAGRNIGQPKERLCFAGKKIARQMLQAQCFACISSVFEEDIAYLLNAAATALAIVPPAKQEKLKQLYARHPGLNLGGNIELLRRQKDGFYITALEHCRSGGGIYDLSELLLAVGEAENFSGQLSLQALKEYNRANRLEKEELDLLFAALLLPVRALRVLKLYFREESELDATCEEFAAACRFEREKNRWAKRLLL